jgi:hypothetical protein
MQAQAKVTLTLTVSDLGLLLESLADQRSRAFTLSRDTDVKLPEKAAARERLMKLDNLIAGIEGKH